MTLLDREAKRLLNDNFDTKDIKSLLIEKEIVAKFVYRYTFTLKDGRKVIAYD